MTAIFLSMKDISEEYGIALGTLKSWVKRGTGDFPEADVAVGIEGGQRSSLGWHRDTVEHWHRRWQQP